MDIAEVRRKNLRKMLAETGMSQSDLAKKLEVGRAYVSLLQRRHFGEKTARTMEVKLRLPTGYFDTNHDAPMAITEWSVPSDLRHDAYAIVPRVDVNLSAGGGCISEYEADLQPLAFRRDWLQKMSVTAKKNLRVVKVHGDSMAPYLMDNDVVLLDMGQTTISDNEVYALRLGDELKIKRLVKKFNGGVAIVSDNPRYPEEIVQPNDVKSLQVLGRCLWRSG